MAAMIFMRPAQRSLQDRVLEAAARPPASSLKNGLRAHFPRAMLHNRGRERPPPNFEVELSLGYRE